MIIRILVILLLILVSCAKQRRQESSEEITKDSITVLSRDVDMTFVGQNAKDQMAVLIWKDTTADVFQYRIELLRQWRGLPNDHGEMRLKRVAADSLYVFEGGNSNCTVVMTLHGLGRVGFDYLTLERNCTDNSLDIVPGEFPRLTYKGGHY